MKPYADTNFFTRVYLELRREGAQAGAGGRFAAQAIRVTDILCPSYPSTSLPGAWDGDLLDPPKATAYAACRRRNESRERAK